MFLHTTEAHATFGGSNAVKGVGTPTKIVTRKKAMAAFDRLPHVVREALRYTKFTAAAETAEDLLVRFNLTPEEVAEFIREVDDATLAKVREIERKKQEEGK